MQNDRNKLLGKIHIAKKELGLDDDTYRSIIRQVTGKDSAAKCTERQLVKISEYLKTKGFKPKDKREFPASKKELSPSIKKIYALWGELQRSGKIKSQGEAALNSFVAKYSTKNNVKSLTSSEAWKIIEILKKMIERD